MIVSALAVAILVPLAVWALIQFAGGAGRGPVHPEDVPISDARISVETTDFAAGHANEDVLVNEDEVGTRYKVRTADRRYQITRGWDSSKPDGAVNWRAICLPDNALSARGFPRYDVTINVMNWESGSGPSPDEIHEIERNEFESASVASIARGRFHGIPCLRARMKSQASDGSPYYVTSYHVFARRHFAIGVVSDDDFESEHHWEGLAIAHSLSPLTPAFLDSEVVP